MQCFVILLMEFNGGTLTGSTRNIRFGLSTDGMNPFGDTGNSHSTWSVTFCIYNLPSRLCMKRKFIMMPLLISGPVHLSNDIDVYLQPLIDDPLVLWEKEGVRMWDEFQQQHFNLRAMLFITIQDGPTLGCDRTTSGRGFIDQDQLERFSVKREHIVLSIQIMFEAKRWFKRYFRVCGSGNHSRSVHSIRPRRECHPSAL
jgi:hypothetical protein